MKELVLLFSGGTDSSFASVLMAEKFDRIHLITYDRLGFYNINNSTASAKLLQDKFGYNKFTHRIINIDDLYKKLTYGNYIYDLFKYGFFMLLTCGLCKLAMHWQTILYCLNNGIKFVCDGSNREMEVDPSQNEYIIKEMKNLYKEFGIDYFCPIFDMPLERREKTLFDLNLSPVQQVKWTPFTWKRQAYCTQEAILVKFFNYAISDWKFMPSEGKVKKYHNKMFKFHQYKREFVKNEINKKLGDNIHV